MKQWLRRWLKWTIAIVVIGSVIYLVKFSRIPVITHRAELGSVVAEVMGTGTLEARIDATISTKIQGRLVEVTVDQNDSVQAGQVLARLEDQELKAQVAVADAGLNVAIATLERVRADETRSRAVLAQAQLDFDRALELRAADIVSQSDLDRAVEGLRVAEADLKRAGAAITESDLQTVAVRANFAYQQVRLTDTVVVSPFDGLVARRDRDPGDVVVPGSSVLQVISTNELWVSAWVDETAMASLAAGQPARVVFRSEPSKVYPGEVVRLGRETDPETREFIIDVRVAELPATWALGQRAEVFIATAESLSTLVIPREFVFWRNGQAGAFVDDGGKPRWRDLNLGLQGETVVEVIGGMETGEQVVKPVGGKTVALVDGARIKIR